jgi:NADH:ubiquinone oxidoreductase subunit 6 (subunit J)
MLYLSCVLVTILICTILSIRTKLLLAAALWLAVTSAAVAAFLFALGAHEIAVIELSVGTGLVPVLFVFATTMMGGASSFPASIIPKPLAYGLAVACALLLGVMILPLVEATAPVTSNLQPFGAILWEDRGLDILAQMALIFAGVLSILNLLAAIRRPVKTKIILPAEKQPEAVRPADRVAETEPELSGPELEVV